MKHFLPQEHININRLMAIFLAQPGWDGVTSDQIMKHINWHYQRSYLDTQGGPEHVVTG